MRNDATTPQMEGASLEDASHTLTLQTAARAYLTVTMEKTTAALVNRGASLTHPRATRSLEIAAPDDARAKFVEETASVTCACASLVELTVDIEHAVGATADS